MLIHLHFGLCGILQLTKLLLKTVIFLVKIWVNYSFKTVTNVLLLNQIVIIASADSADLKKLLYMHIKINVKCLVLPTRTELVAN